MLVCVCVCVYVCVCVLVYVCVCVGGGVGVGEERGSRHLSCSFHTGPLVARLFSLASVFNIVYSRYF